jgi:hypothetical protein
MLINKFNKFQILIFVNHSGNVLINQSILHWEYVSILGIYKILMIFTVQYKN